MSKIASFLIENKKKGFTPLGISCPGHFPLGHQISVGSANLGTKLVRTLRSSLRCNFKRRSIPEVIFLLRQTNKQDFPEMYDHCDNKCRAFSRGTSYYVLILDMMLGK
jgi:hypothetical protein